jgi:pilus assembly protein CpaE
MVDAKIRVVIVDDIAETREHLAKLLSFESDVEVVGSADSGAEALLVAASLRPDVLLMDINMPGMDGIAAAEELASRVPSTAVVMMSVQGEPDYLRRSMLAGAREFLVKPFSSDELSASIRHVYVRERLKSGHAAAAAQAQPFNGHHPEAHEKRAGRVVALYSPKGGVGRTTLAVNLAVAAAELGSKVVLVDGSFQFGDVGVLLNLSPKDRSISDVVRESTGDDLDALAGMLVEHSSGVQVLLAPPSPEMAELVTPDHLQRIIGALRDTHDLIVVDCWPWLHDTTLTFLDQADLILAVLTLEITNIKNMRQFLDLVEQLGYGAEKVELLLNRSDAAYGIRVQDVESSIGRKVDHTVISDGQGVVLALNRGVPFVIASRQAAVTRDIIRLARAVRAEEAPAVSLPVAVPAAARKSLFAWR